VCLICDLVSTARLWGSQFITNRATHQPAPPGYCTSVLHADA